jgi:uncharacterized integral membrane protein
MKLISGIFGLIIFVAVLCFALPNRQEVDIGYWPSQGIVQIPVYVVGLVPLFLGLAVGGFWGWLCGVPHRFRVHGLKKEVALLYSKIGELESTALRQNAPTIAKKHFWERKA